MNYDDLDLDKVREKVAFYAAINDSAEYILSEEISYNPLVIRKKLSETSEAMDVLKTGINISFDGIENHCDAFEEAKKGLLLTPLTLNQLLSFHHHCERIKKLFTRFDNELSIRDYTDSLFISVTIFQKIENCIDNNGEVKYDATKQLEEINDNIAVTEKRLRDSALSFISKHAGSLQESNYYLRNDRITFLIKNSDKNKYNGYVYGTSASGLASYVEPSQFIELNNKKLNLLQERENEIEKILRSLTYAVSTVSDEYIHNFESLMLLNCIFAKAQYGTNNMGIIASINDHKEICLKNICHPLLNAQSVVSNTYTLRSPYRGIIISGSNTGGKTVGLKTIGLAVLLSYLGIPLIATDATVPLYDNVYFDIDESQSILNSLSTFSAHITNINHIVTHASKNSLILIDELISGTDPKEAQAISLAIIERIKELGSSFVITTHYDDIKSYCYDDPEIMISSVGFDMENLKPTYRYSENSIGASNAIDIASRYLDDPKLIQRSRDFLNKNKTDTEELMDTLAKDIEENNSLKLKLHEKENEIRKLQKEYQDKLTEFEKEKQKLKEKYIHGLNDYIDSVKIEALEKLDSIRDKKQEGVVEEISDLKITDIEKPIEKVVLQVGDDVRIVDNEQIGKIESIVKETATVNVRGLRVKVKLSQLVLMPKQKKTKLPKNNLPKMKRVSKEINVVGERVEDALPLVGKYLDDAYGAKMMSVKVIHGIGTGALRQAIRSQLKKTRFVENFRDGDYYDGGSAVTIVEFKK